MTPLTTPVTTLLRMLLLTPRRIRARPCPTSPIAALAAATLTALAALAACSPGEPLPADARALDYRQDRFWAALGDRAGDPCDRSWPGAPDEQAVATIDAFYLHPTTLGFSSTGVANGDVEDSDQRKDVDATLATQAAAFTGSARIFAPYYRQVSLGTFAGDPSDAVVHAAMEGAYRDVLAAFNDFVDRRSGGRPFVLLGHSQGAMWLVRLLQERVQGQPLQQRLVAAYVVGEFVGADTFVGLNACTGATDGGCVISWATLSETGKPHMACGHATLSKDCKAAPVHTAGAPICSNPLAWGAAQSGRQRSAAKALRSGPFDGAFVDGWFSARCVDGLLRIDDGVSVAGVGTLRDALSDDIDDGDYHSVDLELMFGDVRANLAARVAAFAAN